MRYFDNAGRIIAFQAIENEREYQDTKWGTIEKHPHTVGEWLLIMQSELREATGAWVHKKGDKEAILEIIQLVSVGVACLEQHGVISRIELTRQTG